MASLFPTSGKEGPEDLSSSSLLSHFEDPGRPNALGNLSPGTRDLRFGVHPRELGSVDHTEVPETEDRVPSVCPHELDKFEV